MFQQILAADIATDAVVYGGAAVALVFAVILMLRRGKRRALTALAAVVAGAALGFVAIWLIVDVWDLLPIPITTKMKCWAIALLAGLALVAVNFRGSPRWRKVVAIIAIPVFVAVAGLGVNAEIGLNRTLGSLMGISTIPPIDLPPVAEPDTTDQNVPLWESWKPPADMPATGVQGITDIPNTKSGFIARPAGIYLPPAALVSNPPRLPFVLMLMGQPGNPEPKVIAEVLEKFAAVNNGLAPIVVVADQVGPEQNDTLCVDSKKFGKVETYLMKDVVDYARAKLGILEDREYWTIAGYSNGGQCAISLGAKHPDIFGNVLDISGEEYPGAENSAKNLAQVFNGNQAAYDAEKPINIMATRQYTDMTAIFTAGSDDAPYVATAKKVAAAAAAAGMDVHYFEVPNGGHTFAALSGGLQLGFEVLYPRLGLSR